jgi:hypothetical protein
LPAKTNDFNKAGQYLFLKLRQTSLPKSLRIPVIKKIKKLQFSALPLECCVEPEVDYCYPERFRQTMPTSHWQQNGK